MTWVDSEKHRQAIREGIEAGMAPIGSVPRHQANGYPPSYEPMVWSAILPYLSHKDQIALSFRREDGPVVRMVLSGSDARLLAKYLVDYMACHSPSSAGRSSVEVSTPLESENVCPPTRSSSAPQGCS